MEVEEALHANDNVGSLLYNKNKTEVTKRAARD